jgi:hypothetical protein
MAQIEQCKLIVNASEYVNIFHCYHVNFSTVLSTRDEFELEFSGLSEPEL